MILGGNTLCSLLSRYPYQRRHVGFVLAHLGVLLLIGGNMVTKAQGIEGSLRLVEGESGGDEITLDRPVLSYGRSERNSRETPAELRFPTPSDTRPARFALSGGVQAEIDQYLAHATEGLDYVDDASGPPAIQVRLFNDKVDVKQWLTFERARLEMGPATLHFHVAANREDAERVVAGSKKSQGHESRGSLLIQVGSSGTEIPVDELLKGEVPVGSGVTAHVMKAYSRLSVSKGGPLKDSYDGPINPAVELVLADKEGNSQTWLLFALVPQYNAVRHSQGKLPATAASYAAATEGLKGTPDAKNQMALVLVGGSELLYRVDGKSGYLKPSEGFDTPWGGLKFEFTRVLAHAKSQRTMTATEQKDQAAAVHLKLLGSGNPGPFWVRPGEWLRATTTFNEPLLVAYRMKTAHLGFPVKLVKFNLHQDPASKLPPTYDSVVEVDGQERTISSASPLEIHGYTLVQKTCVAEPEQQAIVTFTASKDPGIRFKYGGSILLSLGMLLMVGGLYTYRSKSDEEAQQALGAVNL